ncbi:MAG: 3-oxoacyl-[acyl-carrier-protein] reductase [Eubacterium sp.]|nr:3-oxoacyl-[acyl-carrier-protein] reductase [Eubacterium sp.]
MKNRTAIVTGASRGIGRACAVELAKGGANIVINYAGNDKAAEETAAMCQEQGVKTILVKGSVADSKVCENIVDEAIKNFGSVDILINNAGITKDNLLMRMSDEDFQDVIDVNLKGTYSMMKAVSRQMMKQRYGRIINMASVVGIMGNAGQVNYSGSKAGVIGMTKSFAREIATRGVTVNAIAPGFINTDMTQQIDENAAKQLKSTIPAGDLGTCEDVANAVRFLAEEKARYITGQVLCVDGGMCMY